MLVAPGIGEDIVKTLKIKNREILVKLAGLNEKNVFAVGVKPVYL